MINKLTRRFKTMYRLPLRLLIGLMETWVANRDRLKSFMARPSAAAAFRAMVVLTAIAWLVIFVFADDHHRQRLAEAVKQWRTPAVTAPLPPVPQPRD